MADDHFLDARHPVHVAWSAHWQQQILRLFGGMAVKDELQRFSIEQDVGDKISQEQYRFRQSNATYLNFPDVDATAFVGHLSAKAPTPGKGLVFGRLGEVTSLEQRRPGTDSIADMIWYNVDGAGEDGSQWIPFWDAVTKRAKATGHRWMYVEGPVQTAPTRVGEQQGLRPWIVEFDPSQVYNWHFVRRQLVMATVKVPMRSLSRDGDKLLGNDPVEWTLLLTAQGFTGMGNEFAGGGWFLFNEEKVLMDQEPWRNTFGRIPMWPHYYEKSSSLPNLPTMSRGGLAEISNIAISYMNQSSARDYDAWEAAKSILFALGIGEDGWQLLADHINKKGVVVPVLARENKASGQMSNVTIHDGSTGAVPADVFDTLLKRKVEEAKEISSYEARMGPDVSGESQKAHFKEVKSPRLALMASNREQSENTALFFLGQQWGFPDPQASTQWTRDFDLAPLVDDIDAAFTTMKMSGAKVPAVVSTELIISSLKERGLFNERLTEDAVRAAFTTEAAKAEEQQQRQDDAAMRLFGREGA